MKVTDLQNQEIDIFREELFRRFPIVKAAVDNIPKVQHEYVRYENMLPKFMEQNGLIDSAFLKKGIKLRAEWLTEWIDFDALPVENIRLVKLLDYILGGFKNGV